MVQSELVDSTSCISQKLGSAWSMIRNKFFPLSYNDQTKFPGHMLGKLISYSNPQGFKNSDLEGTDIFVKPRTSKKIDIINLKACHLSGALLISKSASFPTTFIFSPLFISSSPLLHLAFQSSPPTITNRFCLLRSNQEQLLLHFE